MMFNQVSVTSKREQDEEADKQAVMLDSTLEVCSTLPKEDLVRIAQEPSADKAVLSTPYNLQDRTYDASTDVSHALSSDLTFENPSRRAESEDIVIAGVFLTLYARLTVSGIVAFSRAICRSFALLALSSPSSPS